MQKNDIVDKARHIISNILQDNKIELIEIIYRREGGGNVLRIFVDTDTGITINECAKMNELISEALDRENVMEASYLLEVSSPGIDRPLKTKADFLRQKGKKIRIHTYMPIDTFDNHASSGQLPSTGSGALEGSRAKSRGSITPSKRSASRGENRKEFIGIIEEASDESVSIVTGKGAKLSISFDKIASARLHF